MNHARIASSTWRSVAISALAPTRSLSPLTKISSRADVSLPLGCVDVVSTKAKGSPSIREGRREFRYAERAARLLLRIPREYTQEGLITTSGRCVPPAAVFGHPGADRNKLSAFGQAGRFENAFERHHRAWQLRSVYENTTRSNICLPMTAEMRLLKLLAEGHHYKTAAAWTHLSWFRLPAQQKAMAHSGAHVDSHDVAPRVDPVRSGTSGTREIKCSETATA